jgi:hypothetical protein
MSLGTKKRSLATRIARALAAMMDQRARRYFKSEDTFDEAMVLFQKFVKAQNACSSLDELQETFFDQLDDITGDDSRLLDQAANY